MKKEMLHEFDTATDALLQRLSAFREKAFNAIPFEGSWTAAQVGAHLIKSDISLLKMLVGMVKPSERSVDQNVEALKKDFLNFDIKMKTLDFLVPEDIQYDKENVLRDLKHTRSQIRDVIETLDLSVSCLSDAVPVFYEFTRLEIVHFIIYHTLRHNYQLTNIGQKLAGKLTLPA